MMKRTLAMILAALMLLTVLAACDGGKTPAETTGTSDTTADPAQGDGSADTEKLTEAERRALVDDELPDDKNFGNREFVIVTLDPQMLLYVPEDQTGAVLNDSIYDRNNTVETDYGVKLRTLSYANRKACRPAIQQAMTSGDVEMFDLVAYHLVDNAANAVAGLYHNWYDVPYVDFEKPWWADSNINDLTINGKSFVALGDMNITSIRNIWCYVLNKKIAADADVGDLYQLVRDGKWTIGKVEELAATVSNDVNADGVKDMGDIFGLTSYATGSAMNTYLWAFDNPIIQKDAAGEPQFTLNTDKFPDIVTTIVELYNNGTGVWSALAPDTTSHKTVFQNGNAMLMTGQFFDVVDMSGAANFDVGILPFPKFDEEQTNYYTMVDGGADSMGISKIESDEELETIGLIIEAMCAESYKQIYPVYYDTMLKNRYADMPDDAEMMDIIVDSRVYDVGYIYDNWKAAGFWMQNLVRANNTNTASYYASNWSTAEQYYTDQVLALFED